MLVPYPSSLLKIVSRLESSEIDLIVAVELSFLGNCGRSSAKLPFRAKLPYKLEPGFTGAELPHSPRLPHCHATSVAGEDISTFLGGGKAGGGPPMSREFGICMGPEAVEGDLG